MATISGGLVAAGDGPRSDAAEAAAAAEKARRVPQDSFEALSQAGIFQMTAPKTYGGDEADFQTQCDVLAEIARGCPSTSWVATIFSAMSWLAGTFPDEAQEEIFADARSAHQRRVLADRHRRAQGRRLRRQRHAGGSTPAARARTGRCSTRSSPSGDGLTVCVHRPHRRADDRSTTGTPPAWRRTGSHTVVAENVFVPGYRAVPLPDLRRGAGVRRSAHRGQPVLQLPARAGADRQRRRHAARHRARRATTRSWNACPAAAIAYTNYTNRAEAPVTHLQVGEASLKIDSCRRPRAARDGAARRLRARPHVDARRACKSRAHITYATGLAREAVDILFNASGASSIQPHVPIQRFQRDIQALANHAVMHTQTATELYGRVLCGLEPNTLLY